MICRRRVIVGGLARLMLGGCRVVGSGELDSSVMRNDIWRYSSSYFHFARTASECCSVVEVLRMICKSFKSGLCGY